MALAVFVNKALTCGMDRQLVIEGSARRHPFRNHARRVVLAHRRERDNSDWKLFAMSFSAFFVCFTTFIF
ncbi:MAG: hypothetical protein EOP60_04510 [Sphingomonadales bacterium]|nr:MAG: hypothetical protein EOP60_04510 [Sphingomonadales bacterium]